MTGVLEAIIQGPTNVQLRMLFLTQECTKANFGMSLKPGPVLSLLFLRAWKEFGLKTRIVVWPWNLYIWEMNLLHMSSTHV